MLETGIAGDDRRAGPHRHREPTNRLCRIEKTGDRQGVQSPAVPVTSVARLGASDKDHRLQSGS